jgi:hypothetical protein
VKREIVSSGGLVIEVAGRGKHCPYDDGGADFLVANQMRAWSGRRGHSHKWVGH